MDDTLIIKLAEARDKKQIVKDTMKAMVAEVTNSTQYLELDSLLASINLDEQEADTSVRLMALSEFSQSGEKKVHDAVTVKEYPIAEITDITGALAWCIHNFTPALTLNDDVFIAAAKKGQIPDQYILLRTELKATVARDLSKYLPQKDTVT